MNKNEFIKALATHMAVSQRDAARTTDAVLGVLSEALGNGDSIAIPDFGKLESRVVPGHQARNPQTGAPVTVPEKTTVRFKPFAGIFTYSHKHQ